MVLQDAKQRSVIPRSCGGKMSCIFLVFVPIFGALVLATLWMLKTKQDWERLEMKSFIIKDHTLLLGKLIMDLTTERELTVLYVTARTFESQLTSKEELDIGRQATDRWLQSLAYWPGREEDGHMYKSRFLFSAVLEHHRSLVKVGNYYQDELQYYTNIIDVIFSWLTREISLFGEDDDVWKWLLSYTYLMASINYLGAEQSLCSVFHSIICFSHRETFYYSNYSFSGEAVFRLYRQSYPQYRGGGWRLLPHSKFFPNLSACREEIFADMDYQGMSIDPSLCDYSRKNETRFRDLDILTLHENQRFKNEVVRLLERDLDSASFEFFISGVILGSIASYVLILHIMRCCLVRCVHSKSTAKWEPKNQDVIEEEDKIEGVTMETKMLEYHEYNHTNSLNHKAANVNSSDTIQFKVATV